VPPWSAYGWALGLRTQGTRLGGPCWPWRGRSFSSPARPLGAVGVGHLLAQSAGWRSKRHELPRPCMHAPSFRGPVAPGRGTLAGVGHPTEQVSQHGRPRASAPSALQFLGRRLPPTLCRMERAECLASNSSRVRISRSSFTLLGVARSRAFRHARPLGAVQLGRPGRLTLSHARCTNMRGTARHARSLAKLLAASCIRARQLGRR
jgi:hypothetical protein